jgi:hypothetical protein
MRIAVRSDARYRAVLAAGIRPLGCRAGNKCIKAFDLRSRPGGAAILANLCMTRGPADALRNEVPRRGPISPFRGGAQFAMRAVGGVGEVRTAAMCVLIRERKAV